MRKMLIVLTAVASLAAHSAEAARTRKSEGAKRPVGASAISPAKKAKLSTDISFSGSKVDGKYLSAGESIAEVEPEKELNALIGIRKNFRDRLSSERARLKAEGK